MGNETFLEAMTAEVGEVKATRILSEVKTASGKPVAGARGTTGTAQGGRVRPSGGLQAARKAAMDKARAAAEVTSKTAGAGQEEGFTVMVPSASAGKDTRLEGGVPSVVEGSTALKTNGIADVVIQVGSEMPKGVNQQEESDGDTIVKNGAVGKDTAGAAESRAAVTTDECADPATRTVAQKPEVSNEQKLVRGAATVKKDDSAGGGGVPGKMKRPPGGLRAAMRAGRATMARSRARVQAAGQEEAAEGAIDAVMQGSRGDGGVILVL